MTNFKKRRKFSIIIIAIILFCLSFNITFAQANFFFRHIPEDAVRCGDLTVCDMIQVAINAGAFILSIIGSIALLFFVFGGLTLLTSGGDTKKIESGKSIIVNSIIGVVIVFFAYAVVTFTVDVVSGNQFDWEAKLKCDEAARPNPASCIGNDEKPPGAAGATE